MSLVVKYSESPVKLMENQKLVEIQFPNTATEIIGLNTSNLTKIDVSKCSKDFISTVKSNYSEKPNNVGGSIKVNEQPNNEIWYTASKKLTETTSQYSSGLHTNVFNTTIISHTFEDGKGVITFGEDITSIGGYAFNNCSGLTSITIPENVTSIGIYAFNGCSGLTSIEIPNSVTGIGFNAFSSCSGLTSIEIPNSVTGIGSDAFKWCSGLTEIKCNRMTPPTLGSSAIPSNVTTIYVPSVSVDAYKTATNWSSFASMITAIV